MLIKMALLFVIGLAAIGLGAPLMRLLAPTVRPHLHLGLTGLLGLFVAASTSVVVNFFVAVSPAVAVSLFVLGLTLFFFMTRRVNRSMWVWYAALVFAVAPITVSSPEGDDAGLYHLPHQYWMVFEKIVFGLANLHGRFGFNSINEPLLALGWLGGDNLVVVPLIAGLYGLFYLLVIIETMRTGIDNPILFYFTCAAGVGYLLWIQSTFTLTMGWTGTDVPTAICGFICIYTGFTAAATDDSDYVVLSYIFAGFATALKLSAAIVALFPLGVTAMWIMRLGVLETPIARFMLVGSLFLPWIARNLVISGCFAYPIPWTCLSVPWEASRAAVHDAMWIKGWARATDAGLEHLSDWAWVPLWFARVQWFLISWIYVAVFGGALAVVIGRTRKDHKLPLGEMVVFTIYAVLAVVFWFLEAPEPRYGIGHLFALALLPGLWMLVIAGRTLIRIPAHWLAASLLTVPLLLAVGYPWRHGVRTERSLFEFHAVRFTQPETTTEGTVRRPIDTDRCFLVPPPCSPEGATVENKLGSYRVYVAAR